MPATGVRISLPASVTTKLVGVFFRLPAGFHDIAGREQNLLEDVPPVLFLAQQEFQRHSEMLEFFFLRTRHDGAGGLVLFERHTVLVPADALRVFLARSHPAGYGANLRG